MSISLRIKELRQVKKMTGKDFATSINMDNSQYSKIEKGRLTPTIKNLMEIYSRYNASIDWLLTGEGQMFRCPEIIISSNSQFFFHDEIQKLNREIGSLTKENEQLKIENANLKHQIDNIVSIHKKTNNLVIDNQQEQVSNL
jgi:transcriptional regulator with XRE-family HTH domain